MRRWAYPFLFQERKTGVLPACGRETPTSPLRLVAFDVNTTRGTRGRHQAVYVLGLLFWCPSCASRGFPPMGTSKSAGATCKSWAGNHRRTLSIATTLFHTCLCRLLVLHSSAGVCRNTPAGATRVLRHFEFFCQNRFSAGFSAREM